MYNAQKSNLISKRHERRIIANDTAIDIAGCSSFALNESTICNNFPNSTNVLKTSRDHPEVILGILEGSQDVSGTSAGDLVLSGLNLQNEIQVDDNLYDNANDIAEECVASLVYATTFQDNDIQINNNDCCNSVRGIVNNSDNDNKNELKNALAEWVISHNITHNACNALLKILNQHTSSNLPTNVRTLLQTPRQTDI